MPPNRMESFTRSRRKMDSINGKSEGEPAAQEQMAATLPESADCVAARELQEFDQPAQTGTLLAKPGARKP